MAIITTDDIYYQNIANKIREKTGGETTYKPSEMPSGLDEVYEAGKKAEHDVFWDVCQNYGNRTDYSNAFGGQGWRPDNFKPKYDIRPTNGYMMFRAFGFADDYSYKDLAKQWILCFSESND